MTLIGDCIRHANPSHELKKMIHLINLAKNIGIIIIGDFRSSSITMKPCVEYVRKLFENVGVNVQIYNGRDCPKTKKIVVVFTNVWAIYKWKGPKTSPWIGLQTEHLDYRLGSQSYYKQFLKQCDQVWDFGFRFFPGTKSIYFPHMFYTSRLWTSDVKSNCKFDVAMAGKSNRTRKNIFDKLGKYKTILFNDLNPQQTIQLFQNVKIAPMIPRQDGNFELHRFASLIAAGSCIISVKPSKENERIEKVFGDAVIFVTYNKLIETIVTYLQNPFMIVAQKQKTLKWFKDQNVEHLLEEVLNKLETPVTIQDIPNITVATSGMLETQETSAATSGMQETQKTSAATSGMQETLDTSAATSGMQETLETSVATSGMLETPETSVVTSETPEMTVTIQDIPNTTLATSGMPETSLAINDMRETPASVQKIPETSANVDSKKDAEY